MAERVPLLDCPVHHRQPGDGSANNGRYWRYCGASGCELSTAWVLSRNEAITSWNDLVARLSKPVERKSQEATMTERKPLAWWVEDGDDCGFIRGGIELLASKTRWMLIFRERSQTFFGHHLPPTAACIAAEDAARAMVADMAAALGGSVTWGESEVSECR